LVDDNNPDDLGIYKANLIPVMVKAIQELDTELTELRTENTSLKTEIAAIKAHVGIATQ